MIHDIGIDVHEAIGETICQKARKKSQRNSGNGQHTFPNKPEYAVSAEDSISLWLTHLRPVVPSPSFRGVLIVEPTGKHKIEEASCGHFRPLPDAVIFIFVSIVSYAFDDE